MGWVVCVFFGYGTILQIIRLFKGNPVIVIDEVGIEYVLSGIGIIPWEEINTVSVIHTSGTSFISIESIDEEKMLSILSWYRRLWFMINAWYIGISPIYINLLGLSHNLNEILDFISTCNYLKAVEIDDESGPMGLS